VDARQLRNFGIAAHINTGKTSLSERMLFHGGAIARPGEVHDGNTVLDWLHEERARGITIAAANASFDWGALRFNLIDTPGHVDFSIEVERSLRVLDGAVLLVHALAGVQARAEAVWRQMRRHRLPHVAFVNQMDRAGADLFRGVEQLARLGARPVPVQLPLGVGAELSGVIDVIGMRALEFSRADHGRLMHVSEIPAAQHDLAAVLRAELVDALAEEDEQVLEDVAAGRTPSAELVWRALRARVLAGGLLPVLCGSALRGIGVQPLLDAIAHCLPAPHERGTERGLDPASGAALERAPLPSEPATALVFKTQASGREPCALVRVYGGTIRAGSELLNPRTGRIGRVRAVLHVQGEEAAPIEVASAGDIAALTGLARCASGDTLCDPRAPIVLERLHPPQPVITKAFEARRDEERAALRAALLDLEADDPTLRVREDEETGQWLVSGMGELHLEIAQERAERAARGTLRAHEARVAYCERPARGARASAQCERGFDGVVVRAALELELEPLAAGTSLDALASVECAAELALRPGAAAAIEALELLVRRGPLHGFPLVGARVRVLGFEAPQGELGELALAQAAQLALREAASRAQVELLEPLVSLSIELPPEFAGGAIGDLNARGAAIEEVSATEGATRIRAQAPMARLFGYASALRSLSQGRADFTLFPSGQRAVGESELAARGLSSAPAARHEPV